MSEKGKIIVKALVTGGSASGGPPIGPAVGPTGINIKDVVDEINKQTTVFKGLTVPVRIECDPETKQFEIFIETPSTASLLLKELGVEKGSSTCSEEKIGNLIFYKLNGNHPLYAEIKNIINKTAGITEKIKTSLFKVTYIETAEKDLNTAKRNIDIDEECAFTYAYNSMLHCGLALMNSQGYRPKHAEKHKNIVRFCDSFLGNDFSDLIIIYNYMRKSRHKFLYEPDVPCTKNVPG